jgi:hypothetical protein
MHAGCRQWQRLGEKRMKDFLAELLPFSRAIISATEREREIYILKPRREKGVLIIIDRCGFACSPWKLLHLLNWV